MRIRFFRVWLAGTLLVYCGSVSAKTIFVNDDAAGGGDGASWATAYQHLQDALAASNPGDEIWVAAGTYRPDVGAGQSANNRNSTFQLLNDVDIYGAFAGIEDPCSFDLAQRNFAAYETILTGEIGFSDPLDNCYTVVTGSGVGYSTVLDGVTIIRGRADVASSNITPQTAGGGMYNDAGNPIVRNCRFVDNKAHIGGGAMTNSSASPLVERCIFMINEVTDGSGGAVLNYIGSGAFIRCQFYRNTTKGFYGGAMYNAMGTIRLVNCGFFGNTAFSGGGVGGIYCNGGEIVNCVFTGNVGTDGAGAILCLEDNVRMINTVLSHNTGAGGLAGGLSVAQSTNSIPTVTNSIFWDNIGGEVYVYLSIMPLITYSDIKGGWLGAGNINGNPLFHDADGPDKSYGTLDDNLRLQPGSPCIDHGINTALPVDAFDLDEDGVTVEPLPFDLDDNPRFMDDPQTTDNGTAGTTGLPIVDMGPHEWHWPEDIVVDNVVDFPDFAAFASQWPQTACGWCSGCDVNGDGDISMLDLADLCKKWLQDY